jgi:CYTH domain-containing protein
VAEEIERKFLVRGEAWRAGALGSVFRQGYLSTVKERTVRVRVVGEHGYLTVKGITVGATRAEFEYNISVDEAEALLRLCEQPIIEKTRHTVEYRGLHWEIDEFEGANRGLIVAEVELAAADAAFARPDWVGDEVTDDPRYFNSNLVAHPYTTW